LGVSLLAAQRVGPSAQKDLAKAASTNTSQWLPLVAPLSGSQVLLLRPLTARVPYASVISGEKQYLLNKRALLYQHIPNQLMKYTLTSINPAYWPSSRDIQK